MLRAPGDVVRSAGGTPAPSGHQDVTDEDWTRRFDEYCRQRRLDEDSIGRVRRSQFHDIARAQFLCGASERVVAALLERAEIECEQALAADRQRQDEAARAGSRGGDGQ
jgi:hypothetical protein